MFSKFMLDCWNVTFTSKRDVIMCISCYIRIGKKEEYVIYINIKKDWSMYRALRDTT